MRRLLPRYARCGELCDSTPLRMKLSGTIDATGRGGGVFVEGPAGPGLKRCLEEATAHLLVAAADAGTTSARWIVRFTQYEPP